MRRSLSASELAMLAGLQPDLRVLAGRLVATLNDLCATRGYGIHVIYGYRSLEAQAEIYAHGRTTPGPIRTRAAPGESGHQFGLAVDLAFLRDGGGGYVADTDRCWTELGEAAEELGLEWGGRWPKLRDLGHVQVQGWRTRAASGTIEP